MDITTVAKLAGVSRATVSRYLNDGYVSDEKRRAIARVIKETGYIPSRQAKILRTGKTNLIGVIIPKINSASVSRMVAGLSSVFNESQYRKRSCRRHYFSWNNSDTGARARLEESPDSADCPWTGVRRIFLCVSRRLPRRT